MDEQDLDLDFEGLGEDGDLEYQTEVFYWALKSALERMPIETSVPGYTG